MTRKGRKQQNALATLLCRGWRGKNIFLGTKIYFPRHVLIFSSGGFSYIASLSSLFPQANILTTSNAPHRRPRQLHVSWRGDRGRIRCWASAQQLMCARRTNILRRHNLILRASSIHSFEDFRLFFQVLSSLLSGVSDK